jgi:hypothetical protein
MTGELRLSLHGTAATCKHIRTCNTRNMNTCRVEQKDILIKYMYDILNHTLQINSSMLTKKTLIFVSHQLPLFSLSSISPCSQRGRPALWEMWEWPSSLRGSKRSRRRFYGILSCRYSITMALFLCRRRVGGYTYKRGGGGGAFTKNRGGGGISYVHNTIEDTTGCNSSCYKALIMITNKAGT